MHGSMNLYVEHSYAWLSSHEIKYTTPSVRSTYVYVDGEGESEVEY